MTRFVLQGHFMDARTDIDAVAGMKAHLLGWDVADRVVDGFDALCCPALAVGHAEFRMHHIVGDQTWVIDLEDEARVNDRVVLLTEGVAEGLLILLGATIIRVRQGGSDVGWGNGRQKDFFMWWCCRSGLEQYTPRIYSNFQPLTSISDTLPSVR